MAKNATSPKLTALLRRVEKRILEEPKRLNMDHWGYRATDSYSEYLSNPGMLQVAPDLIPPCGTVGCIAGWAALDGMKATEIARLSPRKLKDKMETGQGTVGNLIRDDGLDPDDLFIPAEKVVSKDEDGGWKDPGWPRKFIKAYRNAKTPLKRAKVAVARIEHFIKTGE